MDGSVTVLMRIECAVEGSPNISADSATHDREGEWRIRGFEMGVSFICV